MKEKLAKDEQLRKAYLNDFGVPYSSLEEENPPEIKPRAAQVKASNK
jgi:hypothetical protein